MTCQDCIHFTDEIIKDAHICGHDTDFIKECVKAYDEPCDFFENNDGSYYDGHWHCPRCGEIVEVAGLCYECDKWLMDNPIDDSWENKMDNVTDFPKTWEEYKKLYSGRA